MLRAVRGGAPAPRGPFAARDRRELTLAERRDLALARQIRDLSLLVRLTGPAAVLFCVQPFADTGNRNQVPQERELLGAHDQRQGARWNRVREFALACWPRYAAALRAACQDLGVGFLDLDARSFDGWSFVDRVHLTDHGYAQAAEQITEMLEC
ncbi:hypothetical protein [Kitasatospora cineracea]|uniref:hypothetical protein n=1 Tax=Kitasatospora cineracea TaxID=88074 RepID=UPI0033FCB004